MSAAAAPQLTLRRVTRDTLPAVLALRAQSSAVGSNAESLWLAHGGWCRFRWRCACLCRHLLDESGYRELGRGRSVFFRAIHADEAVVGFVMIEQNTAPADRARVQSWTQHTADPTVHLLWRLMLDKSAQGCGYGRAAMALVVARTRAQPGATELLASCEDTGKDSPWAFYQRLGFISTGAYDDGELVIRLPLGAGDPNPDPCPDHEKV